MNELPSLPERPTHAHKGVFGTCLLVGGSQGMMGALYLAARAALRSGVGLVRMGLPETEIHAAPIAVPEATSLGLPIEEGALSSSAVDSALAATEHAKALGLGPGLSRRGSSEPFARELACRAEVPLVLDADGINALEAHPELLQEREAATVLTPHPGEAARLLDWHNAAQVQGERKRAAQELTQRSGAIVVLKGEGTLVCDATRCYENATGNPGMATGGSGDVLTGILTALLAQGMDAFDAACLAVRVHGACGDLAVSQGSETGLIAGDLVDCLPTIWKEHGSR